MKEERKKGKKKKKKKKKKKRVFSDEQVPFSSLSLTARALRLSFSDLGTARDISECKQTQVGKHKHTRKTTAKTFKTTPVMKEEILNVGIRNVENKHFFKFFA